MSLNGSFDDVVIKHLLKSNSKELESSTIAMLLPNISSEVLREKLENRLLKDMFGDEE